MYYVVFYITCKVLGYIMYYVLYTQYYIELKVRTRGWQQYLASEGQSYPMQLALEQLRKS